MTENVPALPVTPVTETLSVTGQLRPEDMARAAAMGFRAVINNRPDHEHGPGQPTSAEMEAAARAAGLAYRFQPVVPQLITADDGRTFHALLAELPGPVLAFCRTGNRSTKLWLAGRQG